MIDTGINCYAWPIPLAQAEERSQIQLSTLDTQYQAKIMAEVERYQLQTQEKELLNERLVYLLPI